MDWDGWWQQDSEGRHPWHVKSREWACMIGRKGIPRALGKGQGVGGRFNTSHLTSIHQAASVTPIKAESCLSSETLLLCHEAPSSHTQPRLRREMGWIWGSRGHRPQRAGLM